MEINLHYAAQKLVRTGLSSLNQFSHPVWTLNCSCTTSKNWLSSVNQFEPVFPTSLNQFDNLHYAAHAQKLVRTGFSSLNQFSYPVRTSLNQFDPVDNKGAHCDYTAHAQKLVRTGLSSLNQFSHPVRTSLIQFLHGQSATLHNHKTGLSSVNQFEPVLPASLNQFDPVSAWKSMTIYTTCTKTGKNWF